MKKIFVSLAIAMASMIGFSAQASEAVLDTGPGGIRVSFSISDMDGPFDFAKNKGPKVGSSNGLTVGEVAFNARLDTGGTLVYKGGVMRRTSST